MDRTKSKIQGRHNVGRIVWLTEPASHDPTANSNRLAYHAVPRLLRVHLSQMMHIHAPRTQRKALKPSTNGQAPLSVENAPIRSRILVLGTNQVALI